ncbi:MAG TPA: 4'-phosphopantetheinyl transferase superfamily protein, partial [Polyangiales bacterium]
MYTAPDEILAEIDRSSLLALLSDDERERHARFHFDHDRDGYLVAHALTRRLLAEVAGDDARALTCIANEHGRPALCSPRAALPFRFNLSHTRGLVACGVTRAREIGIDVERIDREVELLAVARHVFSPREIGELERMLGEAQRRRFFELWTLKEAYVKAIGKGLAAPLRSISFAPGPHDPVPVHFDPEANDDAST